jgi:hypothetical protein
MNISYWFNLCRETSIKQVALAFSFGCYNEDAYQRQWSDPRRDDSGEGWREECRESEREIGSRNTERNWRKS